MQLTESPQSSLQSWCQAIVLDAVDAIVVADEDGIVRLLNPAAERLLAWPADEALGTTTLEQLLGEAVDEAMRLLHDPHCGGAGRLEEVRLEVESRRGDRIPVRCSGARIVRRDGARGVVLMLRDLSRREEVERRLADVQRRLAPSERQQLLDELRGTAAHELNQPLTSILAYATLLARRLPSEGAEARAVARIRGEAERMADIVRKIGEMSRYRTKDYVGSQRILDLDRPSERPSSQPPRGER